MLAEADARPTAIVPFTRTDVREKQHTWIAELFPYQLRLSTYKQTTPITVERAKLLRVGVISGSAHVPLLHRLGFTNIVAVRTALQNANKLALGRIDAVVESQYVDTYNWVQAGFTTKDLLFTNLGERSHIYIAGNRAFPPDLAKRIRDAIDQMRDNGKLKAILEKWEQK